MGKIVNRRNALLGWAVWTFARRRMKKKASATVEAAEEKLRLVDEPKPWRRRLRALLVAALSAIGVLALWRKLRRGRQEEESSPEPPERETAEPTPLSSMRDEDEPPPAA